jgi:redox-sensitive bicupin YhaK (pirin superfamily)
LQAGQQIRHPLGLARQAYLVVVTGAIKVDGEAMAALDGGVILGVDNTVIEAREDAEIIMVEVA